MVTGEAAGEPSARIDEYFATNLREEREAQGLSQEELARRMVERGFGFSQATIWKIEQNKRPVRIGEAVALGEAFGVPMWRHLTEEPRHFRLGARVDRANRSAYNAYDQVKAAAAEYLEAQLELVVAVRDATDAGEHVAEFRRTWLDTPAERAVLEARVEAEHAEEDANRLNDAVNRVLAALREHGYTADLDPADLVFGGPDSPGEVESSESDRSDDS